ncbi:MAG: Maf family protein [Lachnospiraceae bacterium]|nr:Maf family protein [Lachnospiraceae bacterium]
MRIILASASPRRRELLKQIGLEFETIVSDEEEKLATDNPATPADVSVMLAKQKAMAVRSKAEEMISSGEMEGDVAKYTIIGADTIVVVDGEVLGKPHDEEDAARMLRTISGRRHQVCTGVCVLAGGGISTFAEKTDVFVARLSDEDIWGYIASGEPMDKAGAYGIQGLFARYIEKIDGDYNNVVGLPVGRLWRECLATLSDDNAQGAGKMKMQCQL